MKTAVEWLESEMLEHYSPFDNHEFLYKVIHKAKEMEKEQRQEDTNYGYSQGWDDGNQNEEPMRPELR
jgi:hypothetical protein